MAKKTSTNQGLVKWKLHELESEKERVNAKLNELNQDEKVRKAKKHGKRDLYQVYLTQLDYHIRSHVNDTYF